MDLFEPGPRVTECGLSQLSPFKYPSSLKRCCIFIANLEQTCQWFCHIAACFGLTFRILRWNTKVFVFLYWMPLLRFLGACVALAEIYGLSHLNIYNYIRSLIEMGEN